jgi:hypothetical protein
VFGIRWNYIESIGLDYDSFLFLISRKLKFKYIFVFFLKVISYPEYK